MQSNIDNQVTGFFRFTDLGSLVSAMVSAVIVVAALASLLYLIQGGLNWITSGGDKGKLETAQKHITNAIIGLVIIVASFAIFLTVKSFLGLDQAITTP